MLFLLNFLIVAPLNIIFELIDISLPLFDIRHIGNLLFNLPFLFIYLIHMFAIIIFTLPVIKKLSLSLILKILQLL